MERMKIGFIDNYLSEWHANNYPEWIRKNCEKHGLDFTVSYAYAHKDVSPKDGVTSEQWASKFGVKLLPSIAEVVALSDAIIVLSPDNSELHASLVALPYASGKPTYVDKTFSVSAQEAKSMLALAKEHNTPTFSSSALRFASEFDSLRSIKADSAIAMCGGDDFDVYAVHGVEMLVTVMKVGAKRIMATGSGANKVLVVEYADGRTAHISHNANWEQPYEMAVDIGGQSQYFKIDSDMFVNFVGEMLKFFVTKVTPVDNSELIEVMAILDGAKKAVRHPMQWFDIER